LEHDLALHMPAKHEIRRKTAMELRHLRYFVAVAEEQSFTRAAERLWIAQPGLSQQIRALERELGLRLFDRLSRGVVLTEPGRIFLDKARLAIAAADDALATGRDAGAGLIGHLRLGLSTQARTELWPLVVEAFRARRPEVELTVMEAGSDTLVRDLRDGRLDAAIVLGPVTQSQLCSAVLEERRVVVALSERHRLARCERITADDLDGELVAVTGERGGASYDRLVGGLLSSLGVRHRLRPSGYGPAMFAPVHGGIAIALVPDSGLDADRRIATRPLDPVSTFRFELVWPAGVGSAVLDAFVESCQGAVMNAATRRRMRRTRGFAEPLAA
jgi:DNA-binding transcriptional LysR family regulator